MGIPKDLFTAYKIYFDSAKNILELGAQHYLVNNSPVGYFKNLFTYPLTSLDMNGENGSLQVDLSNELPVMQTYDLITNFGTTEHVSNQYKCWKNVHALLKDGGLVISEIPEIGAWKGHCKYYVDNRFFESMSADFEILEFKQNFYPGNGNLCFCIMKKISKDFTTPEEKLMKYVQIVDTHDRISF
jgi:SAM-dependent methyltransferase